MRLTTAHETDHTPLSAHAQELKEKLHEAEPWLSEAIAYRSYMHM